MPISIDQLILIVGVGINTLLGVSIFAFNRSTTSSRIFLVTIALIVAWIVANFNIDTSESNAEALFWLRLLYGCAVGYITTFFIFSLYFPYKISFSSVFPNPLHLALLYLFVFEVITLASDMVFSSAVVGPQGLESLTAGQLQGINNYILLAIAVIAAVILERKRSATSERMVKNQIRFVVIGWSIFIISTIIIGGILPNYLPALVNHTKGIPLTSIIMVAFTTYAIFKYNFLDIRVVIQRGLIYSILFVIIAALYIASINLTTLLLHQSTTAVTFLGGMAATVIGIFTIPLIDRFLRKQTDRIFFKDRYNYAAALHSLSEATNRKLLLHEIIEQTEASLRQIFKTEWVSLSVSVNGQLSDTQDDAVEIVIPIVHEERTVGSIRLGKKRSGDPYTNEDISLLETFSNHIAIALEKARLYREVEVYSHELEQRVEERTAEVRNLQEYQRQMLLDISHNLQTPLTVVKGKLGLLRDDLFENGEITAFERSIDEVSAYIYNLLQLARLDSTMGILDRKTFSLTELIEELAEFYAVVLESEAIDFSVSISPDVYVIGDPNRIKDLITNLMSNAVKYMRKEGERRIALTLDKHSDTAQVQVVDTGMGIPEKDLPHIFDRFYRIKGDERRHIAGTGLGLAICKRIAELHNGTIHTESTHGTGTKFILSLPTVEGRK